MVTIVAGVLIIGGWVIAFDEWVQPSVQALVPNVERVMLLLYLGAGGSGQFEKGFPSPVPVDQLSDCVRSRDWKRGEVDYCFRRTTGPNRGKGGPQEPPFKRDPDLDARDVLRYTGEHFFGANWSPYSENKPALYVSGKILEEFAFVLHGGAPKGELEKKTVQSLKEKKLFDILREELGTLEHSRPPSYVIRCAAINSYVQNRDVKKVLLLVAYAWFLVALFVSWTGELERRFTYHARCHNYFAMSGLVLLMAVLWAPATMVLALLGSDVLPEDFRKITDPKELTEWILILGLMLVLAVLLLWRLFRAYRDFRYEGQLGESIVRAGFVCAVCIWFSYALKL